MEEEPKDFSECVKKDMFYTQNKHNEEKFTHHEEKIQRNRTETNDRIEKLENEIYKDMDKQKESLSKEITYKTTILQRMFIFVAGGLGAILGTLWNDLVALKDNFIEHEKLVWHSGTEFIYSDIKELLCRAFEIHCV